MQGWGLGGPCACENVKLAGSGLIVHLCSGLSKIFSAPKYPMVSGHHRARVDDDVARKVGNTLRPESNATE